MPEPITAMSSPGTSEIASTRTALLVRWPGVTEPGSTDAKHFVGNVDFFPTFMEAAGLPQPDGLDGRSFVPLLRGEPQQGRDYMFTQIDYTIGGPAKPMRCIQDGDYGYIFNAFSDGSFEYRNNNEGLTFKAMQKHGQTIPAIQKRVDMFRHRVPEEFYHLKEDPGCTKNLIASPEHQQLVAKYQNRLREWMVATNDHNLSAFDVRNDPAKLAAAMQNYPKLPPNEASRKRAKRKSDRSAEQAPDPK